MIYTDPINLGDGWWFTKKTEAYEVWFGPYQDEFNAHYNLQRMRREDIATPVGGLQQNLYDSPSWRETVRGIFGPGSIEAYPPRQNKG
jgi:hypothetical protein